MWQIQTTDEFDSWFSELPEDGQAEIIAKVELLKLFGPKLPRPHADTLKGTKHANLKELRADTADMVLRIAFAFDPERQGILLVGGNKSGVSSRFFYKNLIASAERLYDAHLLKLREDRKRKGKQDG